MEKEVVKILSIDGGGIRGIIPAVFLAELEKITGKPISSQFDLIAGTSVGGILALGLVKPNYTGIPEYSAQELVGFFEKNGNRIFKRSLWRKLNQLGNLLGPKYSTSILVTVLNEYFGDEKLSDAVTDVLLTGYDIENRAPYFFKSSKARIEASRNFPLSRVAQATAASPSFFKPAKLSFTSSSSKDNYLAIIDGGVFANNPTISALVEGIKMYPNARKFVVVSLGTGHVTEKLPYQKVKTWGSLKWSPHIIDVSMDGMSDAVDYQVKKILGSMNSAQHYYRFQVDLPSHTICIDNATKSNIKALKLAAQELIAKNQQKISKLISVLHDNY